MSQKKIHKARYESFGGIICLEDPPVLVHVDKEFMQSIGYDNSPLWQKVIDENNQLSAPLEVHFAITNRCSAHCQGCYMGSGLPDEDEFDADSFKRAVDILAKMGIFHMALGGGEAFERSDFLELAHYVREKGIIPNLTTNGQYIDDSTAQACRIFGQVNISIDGVNDIYGYTRDLKLFPQALRAIELLQKHGVRSGINCLVSKYNFSHLETLAEFVRDLNIEDIEFLRFKPSGRGKEIYYKYRLTDEQNRKLYPSLKKIYELTGISMKIDCSFIPMICYHQPNQEIMNRLSVYGCEAGNALLGVRSNGEFSGCSFLENNESIFTINESWDRSAHLHTCRAWIEHAPKPCAGCDFLKICKGGCHAVAQFETGDFFSPDPGCPFVVDYQNSKS